MINVIIMEQEKYFIDISKQKDKFSEHLDLEQNDRIIFSAKFGDGKTTFLRKFFENDTEYNAIHIYPVNYSVASNEDIFELIKYDILFELIATKINLDESIDSFVGIAKDFFQKNKEDVLKLLTPFLSVIPHIGGALKESTERAIDFTKKALDHFDNSKRTELDIIEEYLKSFTTSNGGIYEENFYTLLISSLVERFRLVNIEKDNPKKTVLVIDDLDRIDPEHIFRILNVFAAHQDINTHGNKFGFDKVIVVCDIDNIRNVFHHKYGANTDFSGYIDKFYSVEVFKYSMLDELYEEVDSILNSIRGNEALDKVFNLKRDRNYLFKTIQNLLRSFVKLGVINVRNVVKLKGNKYNMYVYQISGRENYNNIQLWGIVVFNFLRTIFGDYWEVMAAFNKIQESMFINDTKEWVLNYILLPIHCIDVREANVEVPTISGENLELKIKLERIPSAQANGYYSDRISSEAIKWENIVQNSHLNKFFYQTYKLAFGKGYLK